ncbi:MAG: 23S rRNA (uracil(1939)-C(5))-methyltransferase RlmD [Alkaliphilus sp.]|nr:23S rRNA (uracil(1939)-C(5))-methyltransferase RlmD [bacterium AH-315-G05]PHS29142.1 MAG: 23S rRNA (uracil(1939)-C(5))-methyltransferase RlmD [Alkaliphilus sp.]
MKKKEIIEFTIEEMSFGNKSYGYFDNRKIVVKGGILGQRVKARVKRIRKDKAEAYITEVVEKSPYETVVPCTHYGKCGGCSLQTLPYEIQLSEKENWVKKLFENVRIEPEQWLKIEGSPVIQDYRNKMEFSFGDEFKGGPLTLGMHKKGMHYDIVTVDECIIMDNDFRKILATILEFFKARNIPKYNNRKREGYLRHLVVRKAHNTSEMLVNLVTSTQLQVDTSDLVSELTKLDLDSKIVGILHTFNDNLSDTVQSDKTETLFGQDFITEKVFELKFKISPFSFFQTNTLGTEKLYSIVKEFVGDSKDKTIFDLYCGAGTISQIVANQAKQVIGIEINEEAVKAARESAKENSIANCKFIAGDVKEEVQNLNEKPDIIVLDPPRAGITPKALEHIAEFNAEKIVYVSCNPKSLVEDLKFFVGKGYMVEKLQVVDMFPHTPHVECVVGIQKIESMK